MLTARNDFDNAILVYVRMLCGGLGILNVLKPNKKRDVLDVDGDNRTAYVRSYRKVRRRIANLANAEKRRAMKRAQTERERERLGRNMITSAQIADYHVEAYLNDVACMLVDGDLKRASSMVSSWHRLWKEKELRKHVNRTYRYETSKFRIDPQGEEGSPTQ